MDLDAIDRLITLVHRLDAACWIARNADRTWNVCVMVVVPPEDEGPGRMESAEHTAESIGAATRSVLAQMEAWRLDGQQGPGVDERNLQTPRDPSP